MRIDRSIFSRFGKRLAGLRLAAAGNATGLRQGDRRSPYRGHGMEFADYRPYDPGDDLRMIDWNIFARLETALVRLFHEDRNLTAQILVDASRSMNVGEPNKLDHAGELAACLALLGLIGRDTVAVGSYGGGSAPVRAVGHNLSAFPAVLAALERVEPHDQAATEENTGPAATSSERLRQLAVQLSRSGSDRVVVISDMLIEDDERDAALRTMASASRGAVLLHVLGRDELEPDLDGGLEVVDCETGERLLARDGAAAARDYHAALEAWLAGLQTACRSLRVQYVPAFTTVPVEALMLGELRHGRVVQSAHGVPA